VRLDLVALDTTSRHACPQGSNWNGTHCQVAQVFCPQGSHPEGNRCVTDVQPTPASPTTVAPTGIPATAPVTTTASAGDGDTALCRQFCQRGVVCDAQLQGVAPPEGRGMETLVQMCMPMCQASVNDFTRPTLRQCLATTDCLHFLECATGTPGDDFDP
jgi:hypothetical protein